MHFSVSAVLLHQQLEGLQAGRRPTALSLQAYGRQSEEGEEEGEEQREQAEAGEQARKKTKKKAKAKEHGRGGQVPPDVPLSAREALQVRVCGCGCLERGRHCAGGACSSKLCAYVCVYRATRSHPSISNLRHVLHCSLLSARAIT